jgi:acyl-CoA thioesterase-2
MTGVDAIEHTPCRFRARAWRGRELVAESTDAVRFEVPGRPPTLCFPLGDVRLERFSDEGRTVTLPVEGLARLWTLAGSEAPTASTEMDSDDEETSGGQDILWSFTDPPSELGWLSGRAAFDQDRIVVELVDAVGSDDPRDVAVTRFPDWGDATHLIDMLDVRPLGEGRFVSVPRAGHLRSVVEGSQILAQSIVAAGRQCPGRRIVSAHMVFPRAADTDRPLRLDVEELSNGRTFTALTVGVSQTKLCASGLFLLDATAPDVVRHTTAPPDVPGPYESVPYDMSVTGRDIRVVDGAYTDDPEAPVGSPVLDAWVRFGDVPDDPYLHAGLLAQFTGHMSIAAALRPHHGVGQRQAHRTLSTAVNAISIAMHSDIRADRWMLYHHVSTFAGDGMTHSECRVHDEAGSLLASFTVDAMVRRFSPAETAFDERKVL